MDSRRVCELVPVVPPSRRVGTRAGSASLPDLETLRTSQDFRRVLSQGKRRRVGGIAVVVAPGHTGVSRVGLVVSRGSGGAVARNRIKRRLRHAIVGQQFKPGSDYVIIASPQVKDIPFAELSTWIGHALEGLE